MPVMSVVRAFPVRLLGTVTLAAVLVLAAGLAGVVPPLVAVAVAVGAAALLPAAALICLAMAIHAATRTWNVCRGAGFLGVGVAAAAISVAVLPVLEPRLRAPVMLAGLAVAAGAVMPGMLLLPGTATTVMARLRRAFDGVSIGISLWFTAWLLLPRGVSGHPLSYAAAMISVSALSVITVTVLRSSRRRAVAWRCGLGAQLVLAGLALLVMAVEFAVPDWALTGAALPVVAGGGLIWTGARRSDVAPRPAYPSHADGTFAAYPMLALPVGLGLVTAGYHVLVIGLLDRTAVLLGIGMGAGLAIREVLAAADVRRYARRLAGQEARLRALVTGASDVAMVLGEDLVVRWQSPAAARQFGLYDQDVIGQPFADLVHPDDAVAVADWLRAARADGPGRAGGSPDSEPGRLALIEARVIDGYGRWRETESSISDLRATPEVGALVVHVRDVGERRHLERTLDRLASTDHLTGLSNRRELLRAVTARQGGGHRSGALLVIELHGLAGVADLRGRAACEAVLVEAALRLRVHAGPENLVGRLAETQLGVVTSEGPIEAYGLGVRLLAALTGPYQLPDRPVHLQASVGMTALAAVGDADEALRRGTLSLRQAGQLGRNRIEWYDESLEEQLVRRLDLERHLPGAAGRDELTLVYQLVAELDSQRPVGMEALLRWRHPFLGTVLPGELLPIADKLQIGGEIRDWVLHTACRQAAEWLRDGHDLWLAVNVSARELAADFVPEVAAALSVHGVPPERLTVEVAEAEIGPDVPTVATQLSKLRSLGVRTALDDFGAGDTDLARLRRLPLDVVKLAPPSTTGTTSSLAATVVEVAGRLGLTVVAEGLETADQVAVVREAGCRYGQGFHLARPASPEHIGAYLAELAGQPASVR
jgi:PAS domain S-box-containing protein